MNGRRRHAGFTLIELIFFIVVVAIAAAAMAPLFGQALSGLDGIGERVQAHYLVQEWLETRAVEPFPGIADETGTVTLDGIPFTREQSVEGAALDGTTLACTGSPHVDEAFKCVTVTVRRAGAGEILASGRKMVAE